QPPAFRRRPGARPHGQFGRAMTGRDLPTPEATTTPPWSERLRDRLPPEADGSTRHDPAEDSMMLVLRGRRQPRAWMRIDDLVPNGFGRTLRLGGIAGIATILCATLMVAGTWYVLSPTTLRIALPPGGEAGVMRVLAERLARRATDVRLQPVEVADIRASAEAMRAGKVDLAVVQPDVLYPGNGGTVAILRQEAIILLSRTHEKAVSQLNGKQVAVLTNRTSDAELIRQILAHYQVTAANVAVLAPNVAGLAPSGAGLAPSGAGLAPSGAVLAPNGAVLAPNGAVLAPNGAVLAPNGAVLAPN